MAILKRIQTYFIWTLVALLFAFCYMWIILGNKPEPSKGLMIMLDWVYRYAFLYVGFIIGSIIAILYILMDVFYLSKRLKSVADFTLIRLLIISAITIIVGATHYILEKILDVI